MRLARNRGDTKSRDTYNYTGLAPCSKLLPRLKRVKPKGPNEWIASCPTHHHKRGDVNPSLLITEDQEGTLYLYCYKQCEAHEVMHAAGLDFKDLYPEFKWFIPPKDSDTDTDERPRYDYKRLLRTLDREALIVLTAARKTLDTDLTDDDRDRLELAAGRVARIALITGVKNESE